MDYKLVIYLILLIKLSSSAHLPEVHEDPHKHENFNPEIFNFQEYQKAVQYDPQKLRYKQQQNADKHNIPKALNRQERYFGKPIFDLDKSPSQEVSIKIQQSPWKVVHPKFVTENQREDLQFRPITLHDLELERSSTTPKSKITKKSLKPNSYLIDDDEENKFARKTDDFTPKIFQQTVGGFGNNQDQLQALNALLGQNPNVQLQGLQQLLNSNKIGAPDHKPIKEDVVDVPNPQSKPNIKIEPPNNAITQAIQAFTKNNGNGHQNLKSLQDQLDATANAHAESILAEAQKKALEHVKAQHAVIARAQAEAEKAALLQIQAQNEALARAHAEAEAKRLADAAAAEESRINKEKEKEEEKAREERRKQEEWRRQTEIARERARVAALAFKLKQEREKAAAAAAASAASEEVNSEILKQDAHSVAEKTRLQSKLKLKKVNLHQSSSETQSHYHTHHPPQILKPHVPKPIHVHHEPHIQRVHVHHEPQIKPVSILREPQINVQHEPKIKPLVHREPIQHAHTHHQPQIISLDTQKIHHHPHEQQKQDHHEEADVTKFYIPPQFTGKEEINEHGEHEYAANYAFGYRIRDYHHGNDFGHEESKEGKTTKGHYHVLLPDGRVQSVQYYVDPSGYHAKVSYEGSAEEHGH